MQKYGVDVTEKGRVMVRSRSGARKVGLTMRRDRDGELVVSVTSYVEGNSPQKVDVLLDELQRGLRLADEAFEDLETSPSEDQ